jgi:ubiquinone/menaquinone biosynthesis C-methylase UbiE
MQYPDTLGILDLRWPAPSRSSLKNQQEKVSKLVKHFEQASFDELLKISFEDKKIDQELSAAFLEYRANLNQRGRQMMEMFFHRISKHFGLPKQDIVLDVGCGVGGSSLALAEKFKVVIGIDPYLPDLLLAKKYLVQNGIENILLIQANAQHIPWKEDCFDYAVAQNVIEHLFEVEEVFNEIYRVLKPGGCFCGDSRNRFDLFFPEPHVMLRWVGFFPRALQPWYVKKVKNAAYDDVQLLSLNELIRYAKGAFGKSVKVLFPSVFAYGRSSKWDKVIDRLERLPLANLVALSLFPSHLLIARKSV